MGKHKFCTANLHWIDTGAEHCACQGLARAEAAEQAQARLRELIAAWRHRSGLFVAAIGNRLTEVARVEDSLMAAQLDLCANELEAALADPATKGFPTC